MNDQSAVTFHSVFQAHPTKVLFYAINAKLFVAIEDGH